MPSEFLAQAERDIQKANKRIIKQINLELLSDPHIICGSYYYILDLLCKDLPKF